MNRRYCLFVQVFLLALLLFTGHIASAETSELSWEYW